MAKKFIGNVKGVGVASIKKQYYLSTSASELAGGAWEDDVPAVGDANYLWSRWKVVLTDTTTEYTEAVQEGVAGAELESLVDSLASLETLLNRIAPNEVVGMLHGGTGASTAAKARQNINFIGDNPIASISEDRPASWAALGAGIARINGAGLLNEQPRTAGILENIPLAYDGTSVMQRFVATSSSRDINGEEFYRVGDNANWLFGWRKTIGYGIDGSTITAGDVPFGLHALTVGCSSELSLSTSYQKIACDNIYENNNAVTSGILEARFGGIKVLRKGRYLVSGAITATGLTVGSGLYGTIYKDSSNTSAQYAQTGSRSYTSVILAPKVISCDEGTTLYLYASNPNSATGEVSANNSTLLTVIAID